MLGKEITLGGYLPGNSTVHRLDARSKLGSLVVLLAIIFLAQGWRNLVPPTLLAFLCIWATGLGWRVWERGLMKFKLMLLLTFALNFLLNTDGHPIFFFGIITPLSYEGLLESVVLTTKIALVIMFSLALSFTTLPWDIVKGLRIAMSPLKLVGLSISEASLVLFLALRFVPVLQEEWRRLIEAQESRGIVFDTGSVTVKAKRMMSLTVPSLIMAFRKSDELTVAMKSRGFKAGEARTEYQPSQFSSLDAYLAVVILLTIFGSILV
jgi:energy-coupling factor transport system permease protein